MYSAEHAKWQHGGSTICILLRMHGGSTVHSAGHAKWQHGGH